MKPLEIFHWLQAPKRAFVTWVLQYGMTPCQSASIRITINNLLDGLLQLCPVLLPLGPVHFLSLDQQSRIHCKIICTIQLLIPNNLGGI